MHGRKLAGRAWPALLAGWTLAAGAGCSSSGERARQAAEVETLRRSNDQLRRTVALRDAALMTSREQIETLKRLGSERPVDAFAPIRLEIGSLSRGGDFDGVPGDDGVTVYVRPLDADGDVVKTPGRLRVELLDGTDLGSPRVLGVCSFEDVNQLRGLWHGKFLTQHFTVRCPFTLGKPLPPSRRVLARIEFVDFLSGATLTAVKELPISFAEQP
jgi:hypothetical protein